MNAPRRAVIIALHNLTYSSRVFKQADALAAAGFKVTLVGIVQKASDVPDEQQGPVRLVRVRTTKHLHAERAADGAMAPGSASAVATPGRPGFFTGVRTFLGRMRDNRLLAEAAAAASPDVVIASDLTAWMAGYLVKRRLRVPLVLDVRDLMLDSGAVFATSYVWLWKMAERFLIRHGDALTTVNAPFIAILEQRYPDIPPATAVYSGAFECVDSASPVHAPLRLFFQGRFAPNRRLDEVVEAIALARDCSVTLSLQGFGDDEARLRALVSEIGIEDRVEFVEVCGPRDVVQRASEYDVGLITPRDDNLNYRMAIPIKLLDYVAAGLAVLATDLPGLRSIIEPEGCGYLFEQTGPESIAAAIRYLAGNPDMVARMKQNSVNAAPKYLASVQGERFVQVVESALASSSRGRGGAA